MNLYGEGYSTYGEPCLLLEYQVPDNWALKISSLIGWGDTPGEFDLLLDGQIVAGSRSSDQNRTIQVWWEDTIVAGSSSWVSVIGTHYSQGLRALKCNLMMNRV